MVKHHKVAVCLNVNHNILSSLATSLSDGDREQLTNKINKVFTSVSYDLAPLAESQPKHYNMTSKLYRLHHKHKTL